MINSNNIGTILGIISITLTLYYQHKDKLYMALKIRKTTKHNTIGLQTY